MWYKEFMIITLFTTQRLTRIVICLVTYMCSCHQVLDHPARLDMDFSSMAGLSSSVDMQIERTSGSLIHPFDWQVALAEEDPFKFLVQPDDSRHLSCEQDAHGIEEVSPGMWSYSIETDRCHWLTIRQPTRRPIIAGDRVKFKVWHFELNAPQPAFAQIGLATEYEILTVAEEPIPSAGDMLKFEAVFTHDVPLGSWIYVHLDNHGANSWHIMEVTLLIDGT